MGRIWRTIVSEIPGSAEQGDFESTEGEMARSEFVHGSGTEEPPTAQSPFQPRSDHDDEPEEEIWTGRTHWKHFATMIGWAGVGGLTILILTGLYLSGGWFWWAFLLVVLVMSGIVGKIAATVFGTRYRLTSERLFIDRGILSQTINQTELIRVDDVRVTKTMVDRIFGLGTVDILSTDTTDKLITITGVQDPEYVAELIRNRMRTARQRKSVFVESL